MDTFCFLLREDRRHPDCGDLAFVDHVFGPCTPLIGAIQTRNQWEDLLEWINVQSTCHATPESWPDDGFVDGCVPSRVVHKPSLVKTVLDYLSLT